LKAEAQAGDVLLLHACCHNPTGIDLQFDHWKIITDFVNKRGLLPLVDAAYQGFGDVWTKILPGLRHMAANVQDNVRSQIHSQRTLVFTVNAVVA